jgi:hypothetical protein
LNNTEYSHSPHNNNIGAEQMKNKIFAPSLITICVLILVTSACGSSSTGVKGSETSIPSTIAPSTDEKHKTGEVIQIGDQTIMLNGTEFQGNILKATYIIENKGSSAMTISSMLSFTAKDSEGTPLEQEIIDCGTGLDGKILPGFNLKGDICWNVATTNLVNIYYTKLYSSWSVMWEITK